MLARIEKGGIEVGRRGERNEGAAGGEYGSSKRIGRAVGGFDQADRPIEGEGGEAKL